MNAIMTDFVAQHGIALVSEGAAYSPYYYDDGDVPGIRHFRCTLKRGRQRMTVHFSQGPAVQDDPDQSFEDFCAAMTYDTDSRTAARTYAAIATQSRKLRRFLGDDLMKEAQECEW